MLSRIDALITTTMNGDAEVYHQFSERVSEQEWIQSISPHIEAHVLKNKLLLTTIIFFTPEVGAIFMKNVDTIEYRIDLKGYYLYLTQGNIPGSIPPPLYKSLHKARELARNLKIVYNVNVIPQKTLTLSSGRQEYGLILA